MSRGWYYALVYVSLGGVLLALHRADYLAVPAVRDTTAAVASLALLGAGFLASGVLWQRALSRVGQPVSLARGLAATGLSVFGKYLPGKIWLLLGRAAYVAGGDPRRLVVASAASFSLQLASLWVALGLGLPSLAGTAVTHGWLLAGAVAWLALSPLIFSAPVRRAAIRVLRRLTRRSLDLPLLSIADVLSLLPWLVAIWLAWSAGFGLLAGALLADPLPLAVGLAFPLAAAAGMLAVFVPAGLGAREAALASALVLAGVPVADAAAVALAARVWFLLGEAAMFLVGLAAHRLAVARG